MKHHILAAIMMVLTLSSVSQEYRDGYIINNGDTLKGEIGILEDLSILKFKDQTGELLQYSPDDIQGYGIGTDRYFAPGIIDGTFVEVLVLGRLSLFSYKNEFYVKKDGNDPLRKDEVHLLKKEVETVEKDGRFYKKESTKWKGTINYLISDCLKDNPSYTLTEKSLVKLAESYNSCTNTEFKTYREELPGATFTYGIAAGIHRTKLGGFNDLSPYNRTYSSSDSFLGFLLYISLPRTSEKVGFQLEVHFSNSNYSGEKTLQDPASFSEFESRIERSAITIPFGLNYKIAISETFRFLPQGGFFLEQYPKFDGSITGQITSLDDSFEDFSVDLDEVLLSNSFGHWYGILVEKDIKFLSLGLMARFYDGSRNIETVTTKTTVYGFSVKLKK